jgi:serine/threonine-protein kinase
VEKSEATGERIGGYRVVRRLATGGTSDVLLAKAEGPHGFERTVVLKLLLSQFKHDEELQRMFAREAAAYARISHPSIVRLFDFFALDGQLVMVLEFVDGPPLSRLRGMLKAIGQPMDDKASIYVAQRLFDALAAAHAATDETGGPAPVIHRDVNPTNILVPWDAHVKLADFGVAKVTGASHQSSVGLIKGTFGYMAPEQVTGEAVTPRADVYAAAIVLWEMLTKRRAFQRGALPEVEVLRVMAEPKIVSLDVLRPDVDRSVREAVRRALEPKPERRTITAEEMVSILREVVPSEDGREHLARALGSVRHEPKPQYTIPPPAVGESGATPLLGTTSLDAMSRDTIPRDMRETAPSPAPSSGGASKPPGIPRPVRKTVGYGAKEAAAKRPPLPRVTPPPMNAVLPPTKTMAMGQVPTKTVAMSPAPPPNKPAALPTKTMAMSPAPPPTENDRPTKIPVMAAPTNDSSQKVKEAIEEVLSNVPSSLPPRISSELGNIPAAPAPMTPNAPGDVNGAPSSDFDSSEHTLMMVERPQPPNPDAVPTVIPPPVRIAALEAPAIPAPARVPPVQQHATTALMPKMNTSDMPTPAVASMISPRPQQMFPPQTPPPAPPPIHASAASYSGAIASVPPEAAGIPPKRGAWGIVLVLALLTVAGLAGTVGYLQWQKSRALATTPAPLVTTAPPVISVSVPVPVASVSVASSATPVVASAPSASASAVASASASASAATSASAPAASASASTADAAASPTVADLGPGMGLVRTTNAAPGHRIYLDEKVIGQTPESVAVKCGGHYLKIGSNGFRRPVDIPCGGEIVIDK